MSGVRVVMVCTHQVLASKDVHGTKTIQRLIATVCQYIYLITRVSVQYHELLHEWAWYFHKPKASENAVHECNNCDMHANECNKMFIIHYLNSVMSQLTQPSNSLFECTGSN